ncbi:MAG: hypothetical protein WKH64_17635, partial [Chloroflexia bacterium]
MMHDSEIPLPWARLAGYERVVCASLSCGVELARIHYDEAFRPGTWATLSFGPGWVKRDGVWMLSERVKKRMKRGQRPIWRRPMRDDRGTWQ